MRSSLFVIVALVIGAACATTSAFDAGDNDAGTLPDTSTTDPDVAFKPGDVNAPETCGDGETMVDGSCQQCSDIDLKIDTKQACAMTILSGYTMDGEGFITVSSQKKRVFAMDRWGKGHVIAWCDATTTPDLLAAFDVRGYLGQKANAKVASFGDTYLCDPASGTIPLPTWIQYQGKDLPTKYKGNPALLATDFDAVLFCGFRITWNTWASEIESFVSNYGKGFMAIMDYEGVVTPTDFSNMNLISTKAGIQFDALNLPWSTASLTASLKCVPDVPPPPPK